MNWNTFLFMLLDLYKFSKVCVEILISPNYRWNSITLSFKVFEPHSFRRWGLRRYCLCSDWSLGLRPAVQTALTLTSGSFAWRRSQTFCTEIFSILPIFFSLANTFPGLLKFGGPYLSVFTYSVSCSLSLWTFISMVCLLLRRTMLSIIINISLFSLIILQSIRI